MENMLTTMHSMSVLFVILFTVFACVLADEEKCKPEEMQECVDEHLNEHFDSWPSDKIGIRKLCISYSTAMGCITPLLKSCTHQEATDLIRNYESYIEEICNDGTSMTIKYLEHGNCMRKQQSYMNSCIKIARRKVKEPGLCSQVAIIAQCADEQFLVQCTEAANRLVKRSYGIFWQPTCPHEVKQYLSGANLLHHHLVTAAFTSLIAILWLRLLY